MGLVELLNLLITEDELSTSRVGVVPPLRLQIGAAESVLIDLNGADESVCELIIADVRADTLDAIPASVARLSRDGILVVAVPSAEADEAVRVAGAAGVDWVAVLPADSVDRAHLVAGVGTHPAEFGPLVEKCLVHEPPLGRPHLPQDRADRGRRRTLRRTGRTRLLALARQLQDEHGSAVTRVVQGIDALVGDRRTVPNAPGSNPAIFLTPDLPAEAWPDPARWLRVGEVVAACERHAPGVRAELRDLVTARSLCSYVHNGYLEDKIRLQDPDDWTSITLFDDGAPSDDLPDHCTSTRAMLVELAPHISGEVVLLRIAPNAALQPHYDDNDYQQTAHLGISIPPNCGIRVNGEARGWQEGTALVFSQTYLHEVWNDSDQPRDIVLIDTWHMDLSEPEIAALTVLRRELTAMREERNRACLAPMSREATRDNR